MLEMSNIPIGCVLGGRELWKLVVVLDRNWHCYVIDAFGTANNGLAIHRDPYCDKDMRLFLASDIWPCLLYAALFWNKRKVNFVDIWMNEV